MVGSGRLVVSPMIYASEGRGIVLREGEIDDGVLDRQAVAFLAATPPVVNGPLDGGGIVSYAVVDGAVGNCNAELCAREIIAVGDNAFGGDGLHPV